MTWLNAIPRHPLPILLSHHQTLQHSQPLEQLHLAPDGALALIEQPADFCQAKDIEFSGAATYQEGLGNTEVIPTSQALFP